jgi:hypothetical protein
MRFKMGLAVGFSVGYWWARTSADERRAKLDDVLAGVRDNPRLQRLTDTVSRDARRLGDAVEQRVTTTTDGAVDALAGTVEPTDGSSDTASEASRSTNA